MAAQADREQGVKFPPDAPNLTHRVVRKSTATGRVLLIVNMCATRHDAEAWVEALGKDEPSTTYLAVESAMPCGRKRDVEEFPPHAAVTLSGMSTYRRNRYRRSNASVVVEGTLVALIVSIVAVLTTALYVALAAAPLVIVALVLHWLGAF